MNEELKEKIKALSNGQLTNVGKKNLQINSDMWKLQQEIIQATPFVPDDFPFFIRNYHILNDLTTLKTCACGCGTPMMRPKQNTVFGHKRNNAEANAKREKTCLEKYGTVNVAKSKEVQDKTIQTNLEKYGCERTGQVKEFRDKQKQTCLEKYGTEHSFQAQEVKDKIVETMLERHGVTSPQQSKIIQEKTKQTCLEKFGCENVFQSKEIKDKIVETNLQKFGCENVRQSEEIDAKIKQTCLQQYGVEHVTQTDVFKEKSKQTLIEHYGVEHQMHAQEVKDKLKETIFENYGCEHVFQNESVKQKIVETNLNNYGTNYFTQSKTFKDIVRKKFYNTLFTQNRLQQRVVPLFNLEDYVDTDGSYKFKCCQCGNEFYSNLSNGHVPRCIICYPLLAGTSKIEIELVDHIKTFYKGEVICNTRKVLNGLELDIYLPEKKLAIEVNGIYWHSELNGKDKNYHLKKTLECEAKGIRLIHVFEDELMNKREIVYNKIKHILGNTQYKIGARKCDVREIEALESNPFLTKYHIQGKDNAGIRLGLFYKNRLVAVMTFCKNRIALGRDNVEGEFELSRFATIAHFNVMGAGDKLLKHFEKNFRPAFGPFKILSYADRRWSNGNLYFRLNFKLDHISAPNYWYVKNGQREHRFKYRKDMLVKEGFDAGLTEWQIMQEKGFDRIWDCGNYVFVKEY